MDTPGSRSDLLGLPPTLSRTQALELVRTLETGWLDQFGGFPVDLEADLERMAPLFDPLAREATVRRRLEGLAAISVELEEPFGVTVGNGQQVLTPEGRLALEVLSKALKGQHGPRIDVTSDMRIEALDALTRFYRHLSRRRFDKVLALAAGQAPPMLPVAAAFAFLLLINRSTSADRALDQSVGDPVRRTAIDEAFAPALRAFAEAIAATDDVSRGGLSLYQGYAPTEAARRLGPRLRRDNGRLWIPEENEEEVLAFLARDLRRRTGPERILTAFDQLVAHYRETMPRVANLQFAHERPAHTERLRRDLELLLRDP